MQDTYCAREQVYDITVEVNKSRAADRVHSALYVWKRQEMALVGGSRFPHGPLHIDVRLVLASVFEHLGRCLHLSDFLPAGQTLPQQFPNFPL